MNIGSSPPLGGVGRVFGVISAHVWDRLFMGQANQSHDLGCTERAKLGKLQIVAAGTRGDVAVAFCWGPVLCPLGEAQRTLFGVSAFPSHFSDMQDELLSFIVHSNIYFAALQQQGLDSFHKLNFPWTNPSSDFTLPAARLGFKTVCTEAGNI